MTAIILAAVLAALLAAMPVAAQEQKPEDGPPVLTLVSSAMCEGVQGLTPQNPAVVFSIDLGKVSCFTRFDPVPEKTFIYHSWFREDKLITIVRLALQPPRWSTVSSVQLRQADKGPWRVEVHDREGKIFSVLRFSITD